MRRRLLTACLALLVLTGLFLALPVLSAPRAQPVPVKAVAAEVPMEPASTPASSGAPRGSSTTAAPTATVPTTSVPGGAASPVLTVTRTHVHSFSMVGVTWVADPAVTDTVVRVRVQKATGAWGHWTQIAAEDAVPNAGAATGKKERGGTAPLWTGPSSGVQAELTTRSGARPADVKLDLIDPGASSADSSLGQPAIRDTAHAASSMPPVYSRAQWGADETIRGWDPEYAGTIKAATIHHSADSNDYTADQVPALMRAIYHYHAVSLGWGDIGYNVVVDKFGRMWEGRYGGLASTVIGAHAGGFNTYTFGVSMLGNYDLVDVPPAVISSVAAIIAWKFSLYGVNPLGTTTLISAGGGTDKYAPGVPVTLPTIFAHRDVGKTVCPGRYGYAKMAQIRSLVSGAVVDLTQISQRYDSDPVLRAALGTVTTPPTRTPDSLGGYAHYQNGSLYYTKATGVRLLPAGPIRDKWASLGWERSWLGYPTADVVKTSDGAGWVGQFQHGSIYWSSASGAHTISGPLRDKWASTGSEGGALGYPVQDQAATTGGAQVVPLLNGSIVWSQATGAHALSGAVRDAWVAQGSQDGALGLPLTDLGTTPDGQATFAHFQGGSVYVVGGVPRVLPLAVVGAWRRAGWERGVLGYPTSDVVPLAGGTGATMTFEHGVVYSSSPTSALALQGDVLTGYTAAGGPTGALGWPLTEVQKTPDGLAQFAHFQKGSLYWTAATGARTVSGPVRDRWAATGWEHGLGYPLTSVAGTPDGLGQFAHFQKGSIYWTAATGARTVSGAVRDKWAATGWEHGLGYPTTSVAVTPDGVAQFAHFQQGSIYWTAATGAHALPIVFRTAWGATGYERGVLGYPTSDAYAVPGGSRLDFQKGSITVSTATGAATVTRR